MITATAYNRFFSDGPARALLLLVLPLTLAYPAVRPLNPSSGFPLPLLPFLGLLALSLISSNPSSITMALALFILCLEALASLGLNRSFRWTAPLLPIFTLTMPYPLFLIFTDLAKAASMYTALALLKVTFGASNLFQSHSFIISGETSLYVARACGGGNSLLILLALCMAILALRPMPLLRGIGLMTSTFLMIVLCNGLRIYSIFLLARSMGAQRAADLFHSTGWIFFCVELGIWTLLARPFLRPTGTATGTAPETLPETLPETGEKNGILSSKHWKACGIIILGAALLGQTLRLQEEVKEPGILEILSSETGSLLNPHTTQSIFAGVMSSRDDQCRYPIKWSGNEVPAPHDSTGFLGSPSAKASWTMKKLGQKSGREVWMGYLYFSAGRSFSSYWKVWLFDLLRGMAGLSGRRAILKFVSVNPEVTLEALETPKAAAAPMPPVSRLRLWTRGDEPAAAN